MKSVFLVKTPLQLLNAIEARQYFNVDVSESVLILMADRKSQAQLRNLANSGNAWGEVIDLNDMPAFGRGDAGLLVKKIQSLKLFKKSFFYVKKLNKIAHRLSSAEYIFVGHAKYIYMTHFSNKLKHKKTISLDDGNATILIAKERKEKKSLVVDMTLKSRVKYFLKKLFQGLNDKSYSKLTYFTIYDISCDANDEVVKNSYENIRSSIADIGICDEVYFIGSPISETNILKQSDCIQHLLRVKKYFSNKRVVYISHRRESKENLAEIYKVTGMKILSFDYPLEYQLALIGPRPKIMASFISSALDSCQLIFGDQLNIVSFKLNLESSPYRDEIESIYINYKLSACDNFIIEDDY